MGNEESAMEPVAKGSFEAKFEHEEGLELAADAVRAYLEHQGYTMVVPTITDSGVAFGCADPKDETMVLVGVHLFDEEADIHELDLDRAGHLAIAPQLEATGLDERALALEFAMKARFDMVALYMDPAERRIALRHMVEVSTPAIDRAREEAVQHHEEGSFQAKLSPDAEGLDRALEAASAYLERQGYKEITPSVTDSGVAVGCIDPDTDELVLAGVRLFDDEAAALEPDLDAAGRQALAPLLEATGLDERTFAREFSDARIDMIALHMDPSEKRAKLRHVVRVSTPAIDRAREAEAPSATRATRPRIG